MSNERTIRNFNPSVRTISKLALQIPDQTRLRECSWPMDPKRCEVAQQMNLITSSSRKENVNRYEVRSITNEPDEEVECTIGPEFYPLFRDAGDTRTILEALVDAEVRIGSVKPADREKTYNEILETVTNDLKSRGRLLVYYGVYFVVGLFFLIDNYVRGDALISIPGLEDKLSQLILNILPLLTSYYLHLTYNERVRGGGFIHLLPLAILVSYFTINRVIRSGVAGTFNKTLLVGAAATILVVAFYLIMSFRNTYERCSALQTGVRVNSSWLILIAMFGIVIPTVLQGCSYLSIP